MVGYLDHEMAHTVFSDFGAVEEFVDFRPFVKGRRGIISCSVCWEGVP